VTRVAARDDSRGAAAPLALLVVVSFVALQLYFLARIAVMAIVDPQSTTFQRSEAWRLALDAAPHGWHQQWPTIRRSRPPQARRHRRRGQRLHRAQRRRVGRAREGVGRNERADQLAEQAAQRAQRRDAKPARKPRDAARAPKVVGGSTITQQLAKNLFLSGERNFLRKAQELVLSWELEAILGKRRILEIYLNEVEWGEGVFGATAAAQRYFGVGAARSARSRRRSSPSCCRRPSASRSARLGLRRRPGGDDRRADGTRRRSLNGPRDRRGRAAA
jgi:monofunctional biosynthetic peptidoglycan transglycosylase